MRCKALLLVIFITGAAAHVPTFNEAGASPETAFLLEDPAKSWVFYDHLDHGEQHWFTFDLVAGDELYASINLPAREVNRPTLWIVGPGFNGTGPDNTPSGLGGFKTAPMDRLSVEPFTPLAMRATAEWRGTAPESGAYFVVIESNASTAYSVAIGYRESFSPVEWVGIPIERMAIQQWAGIPWPLALIGEVVAVGAVVAHARKQRTSIRQTLGLAGGAAIAGTAFTTLVLAGIAAIQGGVSGALLIPTLFALFAAALGAGSLRAVRTGPWWSGLAWAAGGLLAWAGLIVGPLLLIAWAIWTRIADQGPRTESTTLSQN